MYLCKANSGGGVENGGDYPCKANSGSVCANGSGWQVLTGVRLRMVVNLKARPVIFHQPSVSIPERDPIHLARSAEYGIFGPHVWRFRMRSPLGVFGCVWRFRMRRCVFGTALPEKVERPSPKAGPSRVIRARARSHCRSFTLYHIHLNIFGASSNEATMRPNPSVRANHE